MENRVGFSDSNELSNGSSDSCIETVSTFTNPSNPEISALQNLSRHLESIFESSESDYFADAKIVVSKCGREVAVHRCILSARSPFFKNVFSGPGAGEREAKFELKELANDYDVGFDSLVAVLAYLYSGKVSGLPKGVCVCVDDDCSHIACRPAVDFMIEVLYASFIFQISELVALYQRHLLDILDKVAVDDIIVVLTVANVCGIATERLQRNCIDMIVKSDVDVVTLDKALPHDVVTQITDVRTELGLENSETKGFPDKHVKRIHRALDSDDVELVRMLLKEAHTNLDDAHALHYAVAYCDAKTTTDLLDLGIADVNHRNLRGYTVLHVAAMRKEPNIILSLLTKGARPSDLTLDGRKALQISKRLTRAIDYNRPIGEGKVSPKERLCIEILEQAEKENLVHGEASLSLAMAGDDLRMSLLYLENRVGLAKILFPMEAKVAMDIAQVDGTSEFHPCRTRNNDATNAQRTMDLNDAPFRIKEEYLNRMRALSRTVELGKRFFPRCSEVLNGLMDDDDFTQLANMANGTPEERQLKKQRYNELQEVLNKAYDEDKAELKKSSMSSTSSSKSMTMVRSNGKRRDRGV